MKLPATTASFSLRSQNGLYARSEGAPVAPLIEPTGRGACTMAIMEAITACGGTAVASWLASWHPAAIVGTSAVCLSQLGKVVRVCGLSRPPRRPDEEQALLN